MILLFYPEVLEFNDKRSYLSDEQELSQVANEFNGYNFEVLPKLTLIPITVTDVVDGDTIRATLFGKSVKIRYLMIDTPEINFDNPNDSEPYAMQAREMNKMFIDQAKQVYLELDVGSSNDKYGRILGYIYADETHVLKELVLNGLATVRYVNPPNNSYENELKKAEAQAQTESINLWK